MMTFVTRALGASLLLGVVAAPVAAEAGWSSRMSSDTGTVITAQSVQRVPPLAENYKFPTRADRVQGMPPYTAFANSPYAEKAPPPPVMTPATPDPVYFNTVMGSSRF